MEGAQGACLLRIPWLVSLQTCECACGLTSSFRMVVISSRSNFLQHYYGRERVQSHRQAALLVTFT